MKHRSRLFDLIVLKSWWMILAILSCLMVFDLAMRHREEDYKGLLVKKQTILLQTQKAIDSQLWLNQEMASQQDHKWIEMILKRDLGLVPKNEIKIIFQ